MKKFRVTLTQEVEVTVDETKFTEEFLEEFRRVFYALNTVEEHAAHLGKLRMQEGVYESSEVEGYGVLRDFGVSFDNDYDEEPEVEAIG